MAFDAEQPLDLEAKSKVTPPAPGEITRLLDSAADGRDGAREQLLDIIYGELYRIARGQRYRAAGPTPTLDTTCLVNEAYLKLFHNSPQKPRDRQHFYAIAASAMRHILVDYARAKKRRKRGGSWEQIELDTSHPDADSKAQEILDVQGSLDELEQLDPRLRQVVECRYFAGYTEQETADALDLSLRTVQRCWKAARVWLGNRLGGSAELPGAPNASGA